MQKCRGFGRFDRLVGVVSAQDEADRAQARARGAITRPEATPLPAMIWC